MLVIHPSELGGEELTKGNTLLCSYIISRLFSILLSHFILILEACVRFSSLLNVLCWL